MGRTSELLERKQAGQAVESGSRTQRMLARRGITPQPATYAEAVGTTRPTSYAAAVAAATPPALRATSTEFPPRGTAAAAYATNVPPARLLNAAAQGEALGAAAQGSQGAATTTAAQGSYLEAAIENTRKELERVNAQIALQTRAQVAKTGYAGIESDLTARSTALQERLAELERRQSGTPLVTPTQSPASRIGNTLAGAGQTYAGQTLAGAGTLLSVGNAAGGKMNQRLVEELVSQIRTLNAQRNQARAAGYLYEVEALDKQIDSFMTQLRDAAGGAKAGERMNAEADRISAAGQRNIEQAKEGLGGVGRTLVDVGVGAAQLAGEIGFSALTGGSAMVPMVARGFGAGTQSARQGGGTLGEQLAYGGMKAAVAGLTSKLSSIAKPLAKAFGKGVTDDVVKSALVKAVERLGKTEAGKNALNRLATMTVSGAGEGLEEMLEAAIDPALQRMTFNPEAEWDVEEILYSGLVGALIGGPLGVGGTNTATATPVQQTGEGMDATQAQRPAESATGAQTQSAAPSGGTTGDQMQNAAPTEGTANSRLTDNDLGAYMRTGKTQHVRDKKAQMNESGNSPILTSIRQVRDFISNAIHGRTTGETKGYGIVGSRFADAVKAVNPNVDVSGYYLELVSDELKHAYDNHATPKQSGDIALSEEDFANLPDYIDSFDRVISVEKYKDKVKIRVSKQINGVDHIIILQTLSNGRKSLHPQDVFGISGEKYDQKYAKGSVGSQRADTGNPEQPNTSPHTDYASLGNPSIPQSEPGVNGKSTQSGEGSSREERKARAVAMAEAGADSQTIYNETRFRLAPSGHILDINGQIVDWARVPEENASELPETVTEQPETVTEQPETVQTVDPLEVQRQEDAERRAADKAYAEGEELRSLEKAEQSVLRRIAELRNKEYEGSRLTISEQYELEQLRDELRGVGDLVDEVTMKTDRVEPPMPERKEYPEADQSKREEREQKMEEARAAVDAFVSGESDEIPAGELVTTRKTVETKGLKETAADSAHFIYRKMVDSGEAVSRLAKQVKDKALYAYYNMARSSGNAAANMLTEEQTNVRGERVGESLMDIFQPILDKGDDYYKRFEAFMQHRHNVSRMSLENPQRLQEAIARFEEYKADHPELRRFDEDYIQILAQNEGPYQESARGFVKARDELRKARGIKNKPVFGNEYDAASSQAIVNRLLQENPEFKELAERVYQYERNLMQYRIDSGLVTQEAADHWAELYPWYVPTFRQREQTGGRRNRRNASVGQTVKAAEGGNETLMPLHVALANQTRSVVREGSKNRFGQRLLDSKEKLGKFVTEEVTEAEDEIGEMDLDSREHSLDPEQETNSFTIYRNGKRYKMKISGDLFEAVTALNPTPETENIFLRAAQAQNGMFKALITSYNPLFTVRNAIKDQQAVMINSKDYAAYVKAVPEAIQEMANDGPLWRQYKALGGTTSSLLDYKTSELKKPGKAGKMVNKIEAVNVSVEQLPRFAEFLATVKKGDGSYDNLMQAMLNSQDVTTNFGRSGSWGKNLNRYGVPFLNPSIQGTDKLIRTLTGQKGFKAWAGLAVKCGVLGFAAPWLNSLLYAGDDEWDELKDRDKNMYYLFKLGDGKWLKIPRGREFAAMSFAGGMIKDIANREQFSLWDYTKEILNQVGPTNPLENNIFKAVFDANLFDPEDPGNTWYGGDIESERLQGYAPGQRYDEKTDVVSKWIGEKLNLSPKKINYLVDQYSGVVGDVLLPLLSPQAERGMFSNAFTIDSVRSNRYSEEFYDTLDRLTYAKNDPNATGTDQLVYKYWNKQNSLVSEMNKAIREIEADETLSEAEKKEQTREQTALRNAVQAAALGNLEEYQAAAERAYARAKGDEEDRQAEAYREANRAVFGAEYAFQVYNKQAYESAQEVVEQGVSWDDYYDFYFTEKEIDEQRDAKLFQTGGEASNAKRDALAAMDISDEEKTILYRDRISDTRDDSIAAITGAGVDFDQYLEIQNQYTTLSEKKGMSATDKATEFANWLDNQGYTKRQKAAAEESFTFYSQLQGSADQYNEMLETGLPAEQAKTVYDTIGALEPEAGKTNVTPQQKYTAIAGMGISDAQKLAAILAYDGSEELTTYNDYAAAVDDAGFTVEDFDEYRVTINGFESDKDENGKNIKGQERKDKVMAYIDTLPISRDQKDFLYLRDYKETTLYTDAPWYKYAGQLPTAENNFRRGAYIPESQRGLRGNDTLRGRNGLRG